MAPMGGGWLDCERTAAMKERIAHAIAQQADLVARGQAAWRFRTRIARPIRFFLARWPWCDGIASKHYLYERDVTVEGKGEF